MFLRNVCNALPVDTALDHKIFKSERFYHPESTSGHSHYDVVQCYILHRESPMKRSDQTYIVPHNVCVCVWGGGGGEAGTRGEEFL